MNDTNVLKLEAGKLLSQLSAFVRRPNLDATDCVGNMVQDAIDAIVALQAALPPPEPSFDYHYALHDGKVHNPLGAGSYIYKKEFISSHIRYLGLPVADVHGQDLFPSNITVHIGVQPNNSPHIGTMTVFILAFLITRGVKRYFKDLLDDATLSAEFAAWISDLQIAVRLDLVDTAPHNEEGRICDDIAYQRSQRFTGAHYGLLPDYEEVMQSAAEFVGGNIQYRYENQNTLASMPGVPHIIDILVKDRERLGAELAPETGVLAMRCACPHERCGLAEKHGRKNRYSFSPSGSAIIEFYCPDHGYHSVTTCNPKEIATLEFNTPLRNLVRTLAYGLETALSREAARNAVQHKGAAQVREQVHMRVTGSDYAGTYSEQLLWRQLLLLSGAPGLGALPPPVIAYAPLIQDWAGSKLSKSLYVSTGAYEYLKTAGMDYMVSFADMKRLGWDHHILFREVERWVQDPKRLFRPYSVDYIHGVFEKERERSTQVIR